MEFETSRRGNRDPRPAEFAAEGRFNRQGPGFASNDGQGAAMDRAWIKPGEAARCHFEIFQADSVSVTSTRFSGGDWRWRLSGQDGLILVEGGGYRSEAHCREAVAILQARAAFATIS